MHSLQSIHADGPDFPFLLELHLSNKNYRILLALETFQQYVDPLQRTFLTPLYNTKALLLSFLMNILNFVLFFTWIYIPESEFESLKCWWKPESFLDDILDWIQPIQSRTFHPAFNRQYILLIYAFFIVYLLLISCWIARWGMDCWVNGLGLCVRMLILMRVGGRILLFRIHGKCVPMLFLCLTFLMTFSLVWRVVCQGQFLDHFRSLFG